MRAWHFTGNRLRDGSPIPPIGEKLVFDGEPILCLRGLHASLDPFDALQYAPGGMLHMVECGGTVLHSADKLVCTERTILTSMDAEPLLREFARERALSVIHLWDAPQVVLDYLMGNDTARDAARDAAWDAAWDTARDAARDAAWAAAWAAARDTAWATAWAAAWAAARETARDAAWSAARDEFNALVRLAFEDWRTD